MGVREVKKMATIIFNGEQDFTCEINNIQGTYHWTEDDVQMLRDRIESTGVELVFYSGVEDDKPMGGKRIEELSTKLAVMV